MRDENGASIIKPINKALTGEQSKVSLLAFEANRCAAQIDEIWRGTWGSRPVTEEKKLMKNSLLDATGTWRRHQAGVRCHADA